MNERTWGFAIVGCGVIAPTHAAAIRAVAGAELRIVVDSVHENAEQRAREFGGVDFTTDLAEMLERKDVDVVSVCVPSGLHAEVGVQVARAGKHLIMEKPLEVSLTAADRLLNACQESGVKLAVVSQHRFDPGTRQLRAALEAGRFGQLILGDAVIKRYRTQSYYDSGGWRGTWAGDGGGCLMNQGVHFIDLLQWMMGPVESVSAHAITRAHNIEVEDLAIASLKFTNGALGLIEASTAIYPGLPDRLEISGTEGTAILEEGELTLWRLKDEAGEVQSYGGRFDRPAFTFDPSALPVESHREQIADLLAALESGHEPLVNGGEARKALEIILACYESARRGVEVRLPLIMAGAS